MTNSPVVSCPDCDTVLTVASLAGRWGQGTARAMDFDCSCGAIVTVISRRRQFEIRQEDAILAEEPFITYHREEP